MAVTQQLARVTDEFLAVARTDLPVLESLCAGDALPDADYADLDWAPSLLDKAAVRSGMSAEVIEAVRLSTDGRELVDSNTPYSYSWWEPPTFLASGEVRDVATALSSIDVSQLLAVDVVADVVADSGLINPRPYLADMFGVLRAFYDEASKRELAVVMWWD